MDGERMIEPAPADSASRTRDRTPVHARAIVADVLNRLDEAARLQLPVFKNASAATLSPNPELLAGVELSVRIELGRARVALRDVLKLAEGSIVPLNKSVGDPVEVYVNDCLVARGEVMVHQDKLCVRITEVADKT